MLELPKLVEGCVITTNFDTCLEEAFERSGVSFEKIQRGREDLGFRMAIIDGERFLLKVHGDVDAPATRVLTRAEYDEAYGPELDVSDQRPLVRALRYAFLNKRLLFVGCSLAFDRTMRVFEALRDQGREHDMPEHFTIIEAPTTAEARKERQADLGRCGIVPIWYPKGEHECVHSLLRHLVDLRRGLVELG